MNRISQYLVFVAIFGLLLSSCKNKSNELIFADTGTAWWLAPTIIARTDISGNGNYYELNGLKVKTFDLQTGLASKNAVLSGSADLGIVASTPVAGSLISKEKIVILCSFVQSNHLIVVLTTPEKSDTAKYSKPQSPIAVIPGTISEWYLRNYLKKNYPMDDYDQFISWHLRPADIQNAMAKKNSKSAKSAAVTEPYATSIANQYNLKINRDSSVYCHRIYLITRPDVMQSKKEQLLKFICALIEASNYIKSNKKSSQDILLHHLPDQEMSMMQLWNKVDFSIKFDYDSMTQLIRKDVEIMHEIEPSRELPNDTSYKNLYIKDIMNELYCNY